MNSNDGAEPDNYDTDDAEDLDDVTPPLKTEVVQALAVLRRYVQCEGVNFDLQYSHENYISSLLKKKCRQTAITDYLMS